MCALVRSACATGRGSPSACAIQESPSIQAFASTRSDSTRSASSAVGKAVRRRSRSAAASSGRSRRVRHRGDGTEEIGRASCRGGGEIGGGGGGGDGKTERRWREGGG